MPEISPFYGIRITMYCSDYNPSYFHAEYAGYKALVDILDGKVYKGFLPSKQSKIVRV